MFFRKPFSQYKKMLFWLQNGGPGAPKALNIASKDGPKPLRGRFRNSRARRRFSRKTRHVFFRFLSILGSQNGVPNFGSHSFLATIVASRALSGARLALLTDFGSILGRFWSIFGRFLVDFRTILGRLGSVFFRRSLRSGCCIWFRFFVVTPSRNGLTRSNSD